VTGQLAGRQRLPALLRLTLHLEGAPDETRPIRPARSTADPRVLAGLCEQALDEIVRGGGLAAPIAGARLEALEEGAALADQLDAFRPPAPDPAAVHAALLPLLSRWGDDALSRAHPQGAHLPAMHAVWEGFRMRNAEFGVRNGTAAGDEAPAPAVTPIHDSQFTIRNSLTLCLRRLPQPRMVRVEADAGGRPTALARAGSIVRVEGPERLSGGWWADGYAREYWLAEGEDGCLWLLFRDARGGEWWVEGWWD
jgi:protein ImuB